MVGNENGKTYVFIMRLQEGLHNVKANSKYLQVRLESSFWIGSDFYNIYQLMITSVCNVI